MTNEILIIQKSELDEMFRKNLVELKQLIQDEQAQKSEWIASADVPSYLGVSRRCWQNYRDKKLIPFSQIGRKIWVRRSDLDTFLEKCSITSSNAI